MPEKIAIFGCKATTAFLAESLSEQYPISLLVTIDPENGRKNKVADYKDLKVWAEAGNIAVYQAKTYSLKDSDDVEFINSKKLDAAFVMGWQRLIPNTILEGLRVGAFGMHGSSMNLPLGRGRSPMNWSLIEGRKVFYTNLFRYDPGIDSGDIVDTCKFGISSGDTAETMHFKNTLAMKYLVQKNIKDILANRLNLQKQKDITPSYYPKRTPEDSLINWERDVCFIERFIRAVTRPFNGAFSFIQDQKIIIYDAQIFDLNEFGYENEDAGTIVEVFTNEKFLVKGFGGLLLVNDYEYSGKLKKGMRFGNGGMEIKQFELNPFGYHDVYDQ